MTKVKKSSMLLSCLLLAALVGLLAYIDGSASNYIVRITRLCAINIVLALSMNLVFLPKNSVNTIFITSSVSSGDSTLQAMPRAVRLYFCLKSRLTSSENRNLFVLIL